jgi:RsiW-degrading membrane proteinase PrsW (M82 family)
MFTSIVRVTTASTAILYALYLLIQPIRFHPFLTAMILGAVGFGIAFSIHNLLLSHGILTLNQIHLFSAPLLEQPLKAVLLAILLVGFRRIQAGEGAHYGFGIGVGFAILENAVYIISDPSQTLAIAAARSVSVNLMHGIGIAIVSYGLAMYLRGHLKLTPLLLLIGVAVVIHASSNFLTHEMGVYGAASAIGLSITGITLLSLLSKTGLRSVTSASTVPS